MTLSPKCSEPHVQNPIPDTDWACPNCGSKTDFYIDETACTEGSECELCHAKDVVVCYNCHESWSLRTIISKWLKKKRMIPCPHCKGTGYIEEPKA